MTYRLPLSLFLLTSAFLTIMPLHSLHAQVSTNFGALPSEPSPHQSVSSTQHRALHTPATQKQTPPPTATPSGYSRSLDVPPQAPAQVVIASPFTPTPTHPAVPPDEIKPTANAQSHFVTREGQGPRIEFATSSTDMDEATIKALRQFGKELADQPTKRLILHSVATLPGDELSMPRRIALVRALAVRSILIRSGIASTRIYPVAQGRPEPTDHDPADRLDIAVDANPETGPAPTSVAAPDTFSSDKQGAPTP